MQEIEDIPVRVELTPEERKISKRFGDLELILLLAAVVCGAWGFDRLTPTPVISERIAAAYMLFGGMIAFGISSWLIYFCRPKTP